MKQKKLKSLLHEVMLSEKAWDHAHTGYIETVSKLACVTAKIDFLKHNASHPINPQAEDKLKTALFDFIKSANKYSAVRNLYLADSYLLKDQESKIAKFKDRHNKINLQQESALTLNEELESNLSELHLGITQAKSEQKQAKGTYNKLTKQIRDYKQQIKSGDFKSKSTPNLEELTNQLIIARKKLFDTQNSHAEKSAELARFQSRIIKNNNELQRISILLITIEQLLKNAEFDKNARIHALSQREASIKEARRITDKTEQHLEKIGLDNKEIQDLVASFDAMMTESDHAIDEFSQCQSLEAHTHLLSLDTTLLMTLSQYAGKPHDNSPKAIGKLNATKSVLELQEQQQRKQCNEQENILKNLIASRHEHDLIEVEDVKPEIQLVTTLIGQESKISQHKYNIKNLKHEITLSNESIASLNEIAEQSAAKQAILEQEQMALEEENGKTNSELKQKIRDLMAITAISLAAVALEATASAETTGALTKNQEQLEDEKSHMAVQEAELTKHISTLQQTHLADTTNVATSSLTEDMDSKIEYIEAAPNVDEYSLIVNYNLWRLSHQALNRTIDNLNDSSFSQYLESINELNLPISLERELRENSLDLIFNQQQDNTLQNLIAELQGQINRAQEARNELQTLHDIAQTEVQSALEAREVAQGNYNSALEDAIAMQRDITIFGREATEDSLEAELEANAMQGEINTYSEEAGTRIRLYNESIYDSQSALLNSEHILAQQQEAAAAIETSIQAHEDQITIYQQQISDTTDRRVELEADLAASREAYSQILSDIQEEQDEIIPSLQAENEYLQPLAEKLDAISTQLIFLLDANVRLDDTIETWLTDNPSLQEDYTPPNMRWVLPFHNAEWGSDLAEILSMNLPYEIHMQDLLYFNGDGDLQMGLRWGLESGIFAEHAYTSHSGYGVRQDHLITRQNAWNSLADDLNETLGYELEGELTDDFQVGAETSDGLSEFLSGFEGRVSNSMSGALGDAATPFNLAGYTQGAGGGLMAAVTIFSMLEFDDDDEIHVWDADAATRIRGYLGARGTEILAEGNASLADIQHWRDYYIRAISSLENRLNESYLEDIAMFANLESTHTPDFRPNEFLLHSYNHRAQHEVDTRGDLALFSGDAAYRYQLRDEFYTSALESVLAEFENNNILIRESQDRISSLTNDGISATEEINTLIAEINQLQNSIDHTTNTLIPLEQELLAQRQEDLLQPQALIRNYENLITQINDLIEALQTELAEYEEETNQELQEMQTELDTHIETAAAEQNAANKELLAMQAELETLIETAAAQQQALDNANDIYNTSEAGYIEALNALQSAEASLLGVTEQLNDLAGGMDDEINSINERIATNQQQMDILLGQTDEQTEAVLEAELAEVLTEGDNQDLADEFAEPLVSSQNEESVITDDGSMAEEEDELTTIEGANENNNGDQIQEEQDEDSTPEDQAPPG
jgi:hypothetical protein